MTQHKTIKNAAKLGTTGSILILTMALAPIGAILLLITMHRLSKGLGNRLIWRYTVYSLLIGIAGIAVLIPTSTLIATYMGINPLYPSPNTTTYNIAYAITVATLYPFTIGSNYFWKKALTELATTSHIEGFNTTAKWVWYSALTGIIPIAAAILAWIAYYHAWKSFKTLMNT